MALNYYYYSYFPATAEGKIKMPHGPSWQENTGMEAGREMQEGGEKMLTGRWCILRSLLRCSRVKDQVISPVWAAHSSRGCTNTPAGHGRRQRCSALITTKIKTSLLIFFTQFMNFNSERTSLSQEEIQPIQTEVSI